MNIIGNRIINLMRVKRISKAKLSLLDRIDVDSAIDGAISIIANLSAKLAAADTEWGSAYYNGGWIPTDEALPENGERVLIQFEKANWKTGDVEIFLHIAGLDDGEWVTECGVPNGKVTAWMPLPKP